jgi:hypothetical protein
MCTSCPSHFILLDFFLWHHSPNLGLDLPPWNFLFHLGFLDLRQSVGTPWAGDQLVAKPVPVHKHRKTHIYTQTLNIYALSGIRAHDPGFRASEDSACLRPLGYRDRLLLDYSSNIWWRLNIVKLLVICHPSVSCCFCCQVGEYILRIAVLIRVSDAFTSTCNQTDGEILGFRTLSIVRIFPK